MPYLEYDLYLVPYGLSTRGRFNSPELNHLYLSTNLKAILYELSVSENDKIAILKCTAKRELKLFDLTIGDYSLKDFCLKHSQNNTKTEYLTPNFISCCCRMTGYDGTKYNSAKNEIYTNYVLFEHTSENFNTIDITDYYVTNISNSKFSLIDEDGKCFDY